MSGRAPSEARAQAEALIAVSAEDDVLAWRNNTGTAWQGTPVKLPRGAMVRVEPGMVILRDARPISFGLPGSADILGVARGRFFGIEMKAGTKQSEQQKKFQAAVERAGGVYGVAHNAADALVIVGRARDGTE